MDYTPDKFLLVEVKMPEETMMKVFASWSGGYLGSDSWKLNSGVIGVRLEQGLYHFDGFTGSTYMCHPDSYGSNAYTHGIITTMVEKTIAAGIPARILTEEEMLEYVQKALETK